MSDKFQPYTRLAAIVLLLLGCLAVLRPFLAAILFAAAITMASWPVYLQVLARCGQRRSLAAAVMSVALTLLIIVPLTAVTWNVADNISVFYDHLKITLDGGQLAPPAWLKEIPVLGSVADSYLRKLLGSRDELLNLAKTLLEPARHLLLGAGVVLGSGVAQVSLAVFVSFFLYRDGKALHATLQTAMARLIGPQGQLVTETVSRTVRGVVYGLLGTALAQAAVAALGFLIAGVPAVALLAAATFLLSLVPVGPPLVWGGAAIYLFDAGQTGWGIFMLVWGFFLISSVDNVVKPMLISRGSSLPFILVLLGVTGGVLAFGFVGLFIGPALLAVGLGLIRNWSAESGSGYVQS
jgi:predicted PurR-regulated permease PerM